METVTGGGLSFLRILPARVAMRRLPDSWTRLSDLVVHDLGCLFSSCGGFNFSVL
jgi:hypothetical protein